MTYSHPHDHEAEIMRRSPTFRRGRHGSCADRIRTAPDIFAQLERYHELDQDRILEDLSDNTPDGDPLPWLTRCRLTNYDHLVLVTDQSSGRHLAFLAATDGLTLREDFLLLETAFVAMPARGHNLLRRMIALALLRIGSMGPSHSGRRLHPLSNLLQDHAETALQFSEAIFFPDPESVAISFHTAALAQRVAREIGPNLRFHAGTGTMRGAIIAPGADTLRPFSHDPQIDRLFGRNLQPADQMLTLSIFAEQAKPRFLMTRAGSTVQGSGVCHQQRMPPQPSLDKQRAKIAQSIGPTRIARG